MALFTLACDISPGQIKPWFEGEEKERKKKERKPEWVKLLKSKIIFIAYETELLNSVLKLSFVLFSSFSSFFFIIASQISGGFDMSSFHEYFLFSSSATCQSVTAISEAETSESCQVIPRWTSWKALLSLLSQLVLLLCCSHPLWVILRWVKQEKSNQLRTQGSGAVMHFRKFNFSFLWNILKK